MFQFIDAPFPVELLIKLHPQVGNRGDLWNDGFSKFQCCFMTAISLSAEVNFGGVKGGGGELESIGD